MRVAILFWGLVRSLKLTFESLDSNVLRILRDNNIQYDKFIHTYYLDHLYSNNRAQEHNIKLDADEYKILDCDYVERDNQDEIAEQLDLKKYRSQPDPWETDYQSVDFFILSMYSKMRVTNMVEYTGIEYDRLLFLRHDIQYLNPFEIKWLYNIQMNEIYVPNFALVLKMNDRMALTHFKVGLVYGCLFKNLYEYSKTKPLRSETFHALELNRQIKDLKIRNIKFLFRRIRANGTVFWRDRLLKR